MQMARSNTELILVDAHSHLRDCFGVSRFLSEAHCNFRGVRIQGGHSTPPVGVLCLTTTSSERGFDRLLDSVYRGNTKSESAFGQETLFKTQEPTSFCFALGEEAILIAIAGRQLVSRDGLEILAIGTRQDFEGGQPIEKLLVEVASAGAIPVVPWGVGKWLGRRGRRVEAVIQNPNLPPFFLGDSGNRPAFWPQPSQFKMAEERGIRNLPGSDPLPFPEEVQRVGSVGVALEGDLDLETPTQDLKERLLDPSTTFRPFGQRETPLRFVRNQFKMQLRKLTQ